MYYTREFSFSFLNLFIIFCLLGKVQIKRGVLFIKRDSFLSDVPLTPTAIDLFFARAFSLYYLRSRVGHALSILIAKKKNPVPRVENPRATLLTQRFPSHSASRLSRVYVCACTRMCNSANVHVLCASHCKYSLGKRNPPLFCGIIPCRRHESFAVVVSGGDDILKADLNEFSPASKNVFS